MVTEAKKFPTSISLLGQSFRIELVDNLDEEGAVGITYGDTHLIRISKALDSSRRWRTLLHECIHATMYVNGLGNVLTEEVEEVIAQSLEYSLSTFIHRHGEEFMKAVEGDRHG